MMDSWEIWSLKWIYRFKNCTRRDNYKYLLRFSFEHHIQADTYTPTKSGKPAGKKKQWTKIAIHLTMRMNGIDDKNKISMSFKTKAPYILPSM